MSGLWIKTETLLPNVGYEILYVRWKGWCNKQDESIHQLLYGDPSKPEVYFGEVIEVGDEGNGNFIRIGNESPDHIAFWMPLPDPPIVQPRNFMSEPWGDGKWIPKS